MSNTMGDNLLYADSVFDVTDDVVAKLKKDTLLLKSKLINIGPRLWMHRCPYIT